MGFHVYINDNSRAFLQKMRSNPAEVFDKPYKGYLLFLMGHADKPACEWMRDNILTLDSLTGDDIAFALFAARFDFTLHTTAQSTTALERLRELGLPTWDERPRNLGLLPIDELRGEDWMIEPLVKSGRFGLVVQGDELTAMTYAVDDIAKRLQILDKLPCVVVLDAIPSDEIHVITLAGSICEQFLTLLRKAMSDFSKHDGYDQLETDVARLLLLHQEVEVIKRKCPMLQEALRQMEEQIALTDISAGVSKWDEGQITRALQKAKRALSRGSLKRLRRELTGCSKSENRAAVPLLTGINRETLERILASATASHPLILAVNSALDSLQHLSVLRGPERKDLDRVLTAKLSNLVSLHQVQLPDSPLNNLDKTVGTLKQLNKDLVERVAQLFPSAEVLASALWSARKLEIAQRKVALRKEANKLREEIRQFAVIEPRLIQAAEERLDNELRNFLQNKPPSLWKAISTQLRDMTLAGHATSVKSRLNEIATGMLSPEFIVKCIEVASK